MKNFTLKGIMLAICLIFGTQLTFAQFSAGDGSEGTPYEIADKAALLHFMSFDQTNADNQYKFYKLTADIDMAGEAWTPINKFYGTFNGNSHVIKNLTIDGAGGVTGFIANLEWGPISKLGLINPVITNGGNQTGPIVGLIKGNANNKISDCFVKGGSVDGSNQVGGIAGSTWADGTVENCFSTITITSAGIKTGGILGNISQGHVKNCAFYGTMTVNNAENPDAKGLPIAVLQHANSTITDCYYDVNCGALAADAIDAYVSATFIAHADYANATALTTEELKVESNYPRLSFMIWTMGSDFAILKWSETAMITSIKNVESLSMDVYPNPSNGIINVNLKKNAELTISDIIGKEIYKQAVYEGRNTIELPSELSGIYLLTILEGNSRKTVKIHIK